MNSGKGESGSSGASCDELRGRVAVVTGGAFGIGHATALLFARRGARVFIGDVSRPAEEDRESREAGIVFIPCDVRKEADVRRLIQEAVTQGGRLDILVINAGIGLVKQIPEVTEEEWDAVLDTNLKGAFLCAKHAIPHLRNGGGAIVNVASNAGILPRAHDPVYSTSKGALVAFTKSLALCHARDRIRVNAVCPGPVGQTRMMQDDLAKSPNPEEVARKYIATSPLAKAYGRMIDPAEIAEAIFYVASDRARMVTGTIVAIDGGKSLGVPPADG